VCGMMFVMKKKKWIKWGSIVTALLVISVLLVYYASQIERQDYFAIEKQAKQDFMQLLSSIQEGEIDARPKMIGLFKTHNDLFLPYGEIGMTDSYDMLFLLLMGEWKDRDLNPVKNILSRNQTAINELVGVLLESDTFVTEVVYPEEMLIVGLSSFDDQGMWRDIPLPLLAEVRRSSENEDWVRVIKFYMALERLMEISGTYPAIISSLQSTSMLSFICYETRLLAYEHGIPVAVLNQFRASILNMLGSHNTLQELMFEGERFMSMEFIALIYQQKSSWRDYFDWANIQVLVDQYYENVRLSRNAPRAERVFEGVSGFGKATELLNMSGAVLPRYRVSVDMLIHDIISTIAVLDLERIYSETGRYPQELPGGIVELIPEGIRFGEGIVYEVLEGGQDYVLRLPAEVPERWREHYKGVYQLERDPLSEDDIELLERLAEEMAEPVGQE